LDQYVGTGFALGGLFDPEFGTYSSIKVTPTNIALAVENLGGGTVLLTGASSDLFSGAVLGSADSAVTLFGTDLALIDGALCDVDSVLCGLNVNP
jgi:dihydropteroate synthase